MDEAMIEELFKRYIGIISEDFQHKLNIVIDGQQLLGEKLERVAGEIKEDFSKLERRQTIVEVKIDALAKDLAAHRADTEAHHGLYLVKEG